jgi:hypothetical protein
MSGSLKTIGQGLNFDSEKLNLGIGSSFIPNTRLSVFNNNPSSWRTAIFKDTFSSDFITIGNFNTNPHISAMGDNGIFRDLYLNNLGIASQPSSLIGNIIMNGKITIGNSSNNSLFNHSLDVYTNSSNIAVFRNSNLNLSLSATPSNLIFNTNSKQITFNSDVYISGFMIGSNYLSNVSNNPLLYKMPANWIKTNTNSCLTTNTNNEFELALDPNAGLFINPQKQLSFTGTITQIPATISIGNTNSFYTCNLYINDFITVNSNNYLPNFNEKVFINGAVAIGSNNPNPNLNFNKNSYSLFVASNAFFNSNINVAGIISGNGDKITNVNLSNVVNNPLVYKLPSSWLNIDNSVGFYIQPSGTLSLNTAQLVSTASSSINFWNSNNNPSIIYFNNGDSYLGIGNTNPKSHLYVGKNANLLRLTSLANINDNYFSQIGTTDTDSNNTKIRLISPLADVSLSSGSIFYTTCGNNNPIHSFNYELDGIRNELLKIEKNGLITIQSNLTVGNSLNTNGKIIIGQSNFETTNYSLYVNSNAKFNNKVVIGNIINSFDGLPMITEYPLNVYGNIGITGNIFTTSDEKIKTNIKTIDNALDKIINCRGVSFNYIDDSNKPQIGVIAQEIEKIMPEIVETNNNGFKNVNYLSIIGYLIEAIKDLNNKINYIR